MGNIDANTWMVIVVVVGNLIGVTVVVARNSFGIKQLNKTLKEIAERFTAIDTVLTDHQHQLTAQYGKICEINGKLEK